MSKKRKDIDRGKKNRLLTKEVKSINIEKSLLVSDLVDDFSSMSIQARNLGQAAKIYERMLKDKSEPTIFLGLSGPLIAAGLRNTIKKMIEIRAVDVIVSTGAIIYQDFYQAKNGRHYHGHPQMNDAELENLWIDRIYDTLVDDELFFDLDHFIGNFTEKLEPRNYSSREFVHELSKAIDDEDSIIKTAADNDVPIIVPALNDSSIGVGMTAYYAKNIDKPRMTIDPIKDNYEICQIILQSRSTATIYVGGGVPKNFINDAIVMSIFDFGAKIKGHKYAVQLTMAIPFDGGLSGSTLKEAISWGKIRDRAQYSSVFIEASIGLPLLVSYIYNNSGQIKRKKKKFDFSKRLKYYESDKKQLRQNIRK